MRILIWVTLIVSLLLLSCSKEEDQQLLEGNYTGKFSYSNPYIRVAPSHVVLHLQNNSFSGTSSNARMPAIGFGNWRADGQTIRFENNNRWTADFDWNLILEGEFQYRLSGENLQIWKEIGNTTYTYHLTRTP